ncbi:interleukin-2 receptor subunit beta [Kryptolebias marmoratus]|uniref:interleukin-2 receptor subunit beta n=1 Tax=Kryptolebias marmoratus TaxID=37003 RepID=UPI000D52F345|nr:interleukin-2 receptor subunit beta [Kryptolebias marmoratus]XP_037830834.1 interleukin-2 receptor subunit beta [Kryptolebias marmoratus]
MERKKKGTFLSVVLHMLQICIISGQDCPKHPDKNLSCNNDFNHTITCLWNDSSVSYHNNCTLHAEKVSSYTNDKTSCDLKPFDSSKPALRECSLIFSNSYIFSSFHVVSITLSCARPHNRETISYKPACHIKVNPPGKPNVSFTTVSWFTQVTKHVMIPSFDSQLEWKRQDQSWSDPSVQKKECICSWSCKAELDPNSMLQNETYEARVRVKARLVEEAKTYEGIWSEWSPTESWVSLVGRTRPLTGMSVSNSNIPLASLLVFGMLLGVIVLKMRNTTWVYIVKKIQGPPLPDPGKSARFQSLLSPNLSSEPFHSFFNLEDIISLDATSTVDAVTISEPKVKMMPENYNYESSCSSFLNPSYTELRSPSTVSSFTMVPCAIDAPYRPVLSQVEEKNTKQGNNVAAENGMEIMKLIVNGSKNSEAVKVILDYEKVEKLQMERLRLHSVDSGMCSCEEVSQESMEEDSINMTDGQDEGTQSEAEKEGDGMKADVQKLIGSSGGKLGKNSIQVCFDYKRVPILQAESPELPSLDSDVEHESQEESMEDQDQTTQFLFLPHSPGDLKCSSSPYSLIFTESDLGPSNNILEKMTLMSNSMQVEPCGDGYKSVRQEEN